MAPPIVESIAWGVIKVDDGSGTVLTFKDAQLFPDGAQEWDWGETGTRHSPGVLEADVRRAVERGAEEVVLSRGMQLRLGVSDGAHEYLRSVGIEPRVLPTPDAVEEYNRLARERPTAALLHSTC